MKYLFSLLCIFFLSERGFAQSKQIPVLKISSQEVKALRCLDSASRVSTTCPLGLDGFNVIFYASYMDKSKGELRLIGRVCVSGAMNSTGLSEVEIFKSTKEKNILTDRNLIGRTTYDKEFINNDGFFDIALTIKKNESLFFYSSGHFLKEFTVFKLLQ
ncbi:MAG TPA: hypothetical protein VFV31_03035 [Chitinophagaceae bacterium]|nr:hypothetical protein [Chitinophagaceae bacterium]